MYANPPMGVTLVRLIDWRKIDDVMLEQTVGVLDLGCDIGDELVADDGDGWRWFTAMGIPRESKKNKTQQKQLNELGKDMLQ
ncbi:hypothetical protein L6452_22534 [Arctium lappa]|uniref:Uncharacterized protein n=1 Tax=Arctium lappa TaxID=4217 RepID=A0ACB9B1T0_ARCLA|nr:hypothetical protein L6452_22534 [Arctium lappa]